MPGDVQVECDIVNVAHRLADCTLLEPTHLSRELLVREPAYRNLGLAPEDGIPLFDSAADITAESPAISRRDAADARAPAVLSMRARLDYRAGS